MTFSDAGASAKQKAVNQQTWTNHVGLGVIMLSSINDISVTPMTKTECFNGVRRLRALGLAGLLLVVLGGGTGTALAETKGDTKLDDTAKEVGNNFGELLEGMGQELKKVIGSDNEADSKKVEKEKKEEADDKSGKTPEKQ
jgi:hypothetical protein